MKKIHLIGNAHLDPVWLWRWQEGFSEVLATFRSALDRMKDFDDFKFTSACAVYYEWIERIDPDMFEEIKQRVKEGRWSIVGGWYLQPDCNMPDGESFARHGLISQRYFKENFGVTAKTGYNVDSFGHTQALPKILKASGMDNYIFMRPSCEEQDRKESLFMWESDDGTRVCTYRIPWFYNYDLGRMECFNKLKEKANSENMDFMAFYGVGNHGGGPTIALIDAINKLGIEGMVYSTPDEYFRGVDKDKLSVMNDELQHHARGCYSAESYVKMANRKCEQNLLAAEKLCIMAKELTGDKYPDKKLRKAWKNVLFNQFHDILCGCCVKKAYEDASHLYGETMSITEQAMNLAMQKIAWNIDTLGDETLPSYKSHINWKIWEHEVLGTPVIVFNPNSWNVKTLVAINQDVKKMIDNNGQEIPFQFVRGDQTNNEDKYHTAFVAEVPAMGYAVYRFFTEKECVKSFKKIMTVAETYLENDKIRVEFDKSTGDICKFYDKEQAKYIINKPCGAVLLDDTDCDTWAHDKKILGETVGMFENPEFKVIEDGMVRCTVRVTAKYNNSVLQRDFSIVPGSKEVRVKTKVDFHEEHRVLKFTFPMTDEKVIAKIPYGSITRCGYTGEEPCGNWIASGLVAVANDSKYGYDTDNDDMRMTMLRSAIYADHFGKRDEFCEFMEQGISEFTYSVFPYENDASAEKTASELNFALPHIMGSFHKGNLPEVKSCFECDNDSVIVTAVKQAEDSEDIVLRAYETNGNDTDVKFKLFDKEINAKFSHNGVKTFKGSNEVNMIEW